jgi:hypothetical protein
MEEHDGRQASEADKSGVPLSNRATKGMDHIYHGGVQENHSVGEKIRTFAENKRIARRPALLNSQLQVKVEETTMRNPAPVDRNT